MRNLSFIVLLILSLSAFIADQATAQTKNKGRNKNTGKDTSWIDTTDQSTKTGTATIGSGSTMTDTSKTAPPDTTRTLPKTRTQPGSGTEKY
jgi:hypothetical protein